jgi:mRNA interferase RelE/StbE/toxin YoeB
MYSLEVRESVDRIFSKLAKKNPKQMQIIDKKIKQILEKPHHFKPLRAPMQHLRRVHIDKSFVLANPAKAFLSFFTIHILGTAPGVKEPRQEGMQF